MYNVSVKVKRRKSVEAGKPMPLYMQVIYRREVRKIALPYLVSGKEWDGASEKINIPGDIPPERAEELQTIREQLVRDCRTVRSVIYSVEKRGAFTLDEIVASCNERFSVACLSKYVEKLSGELHEKGKHETARHYCSMLNCFMKFRNRVDLRLDEIDAPLLKEYETYLFSSGICANSVSFYLRTLRTIRNRAVKDNLVEPSPGLFSNVNTRIEKTRKRAVKEDVIRAIIALQLLSPELTLARDLFIFSYYARGMAFVDLAHLRKENIKGDKLVYIRHKTGEQLQVRLLPVMKSLISCYRRAGSPYLFPALKNVNPTPVEYASALRLQNKRLKKLGKLVGVEGLSTYVARHSWPSIAAAKGISEEVISKGMGHLSLDTTRIYINFWDDRELDRANEIVILGKPCNTGFVNRMRGRT